MSVSLSNDDRCQLALRVAIVDEVPGMASHLRAGPLRIQLFEARIVIGIYSQAAIVIVEKARTDIGRPDRVVSKQRDEPVPLRDIHIP